jgi:hypothetical protein
MYEKEPLDPRENSLFTKRIVAASLMVFPPVTQVATFFARMPTMTLLGASRSFYLPVTKSKLRYSSLAGVTQW